MSESQSEVTISMSAGRVQSGREAARAVIVTVDLWIVDERRREQRHRVVQRCRR